jgi:hypothetical protein
MLTKRQILNRKRRAPPNYDASPIMRLPPELHLMLFDYLDELDRICLLLTCKYFARVGSIINEDSHSIQVGTDLIRVNGGLSNRMPRRLNLCTKCGIMRPKCNEYWEVYRCRWNWRKLIPAHNRQKFINRVDAWSTGWSTQCPRCFGSFVAQGNMDVSEMPFY